jgi:hypothetical protein
MKTLTAEKALQNVEETAERIRSDEVEIIGTVSPGDVIRQGDLMLVAVKGLPARRILRTNRQLVVGTSIGSRHIIDGDIELFDVSPEDSIAIVREAFGKPLDLFVQLMGPVFKTIGESVLTHPVHGDKVLPVGECFATVHQRQFAEEIRRQLD